MTTSNALFTTPFDHNTDFTELADNCQRYCEALEIVSVTPWAFRDDIRVKTYADGTTEEIYMIYLIFDCISANRDVTFNDEFQEIAWVNPESFKELDLNDATRITFAQKGLL